MNRCHWQDWAGHVERALEELEQACSTVFVGGLSMGALLTLTLAQRRPELRGIMLYSPATRAADRRIWLTPVAKHFVRQFGKTRQSDQTDPQAKAHIWSYEVNPVNAAHELFKLQRHVRRNLRQVTCPALIIYSTRDTAIHASSARFTYQRMGATDKELVELHASGHVLTADSEWRTVAQRTLQFIARHS
jgi:carboxylesterase